MHQVLPLKLYSQLSLEIVAKKNCFYCFTQIILWNDFNSPVQINDDTFLFHC